MSSKFLTKKVYSGVAALLVLAGGLFLQPLLGGCSDTDLADREGQAAVKPAYATASAASGTKSEYSKKKVLRLATWNVHDLFDTVDDPNYDVVLTPEEYEAKLDGLAAGLKTIGADIVGVEEVENLKCLEDLGQKSGYPYTLLVEGNDTYRGIDVGVLSKVPIKNYVSHVSDVCTSPEGDNARFSRDCLEVHFDHFSRLTMLLNHFKSQRYSGKGGDRAANDAKRSAQAQRVKEISSSLAKYPVVIVGDLNCDPDHPSLHPLLSSKSLFDVLDLYQSERVTFKTKKYSSSLDYLLVNDNLRPYLRQDSVRIHTQKEVSSASDHRAVSADFDFTSLASASAGKVKSASGSGKGGNSHKKSRP